VELFGKTNPSEYGTYTFMKQILQHMGSGETMIVETPCPSVTRGTILIQSVRSLISAGTERMLMEFGKAGFIEKARQQPEKVKMVLDKVKTEGLLTTIEAVRSKLDQPLPLGYSNAGRVIGVGPSTREFREGDRVVSNGPHAEIVRVHQNLAVPIPDSVSDDEAAFTVLGSIGLQGIRLAQPTLGESFVVTGAGLIGLLTIQLLQAHGCRVLAIDFDQAKLDLAATFGAETCNPGKGHDPVRFGMAFSRGKGVDGVIITAATQSSEPVSQAAQMCRKRGRIVLVGVTGLELNRSEFYQKELSFQVSCSYGPGRYDPLYEEQGHDYPLGFVRWTEKRNFEAILDMMAHGRLNVKPLISKRFHFEKALEAYEELGKNRGTLGIILEYPQEPASNLISREIQLNPQSKNFSVLSPVIGMIGAGNYASRILIPAFAKAHAQLHTVVTSSGVSGTTHGAKSGFQRTSTDLDAVMADETINTLVIATRHNTHAKFTAEALKRGKNVFVEKPLAITTEEIDEIVRAYTKERGGARVPQLMVGYNRRFAPQIQKAKELLLSVKEPKVLMMTMNAGCIPSDHWTQDPEIGGGRIIGEACHYIDLMRYLTGEKIVSVQAQRIGRTSGNNITEDKAAIMLGFADGSFGTIHYLANGSTDFPKERIEIFASGAILQLDNFIHMTGFGWPGFKKMNLWWQDKGQNACAEAFIKGLTDGRGSPIPFDEIIEVARVTIQAATIIRQQH